MADTVSMALAELVRKAEQQGDVDFLREGVRVLSQALMEVEVSQQLGAERYERTAERVGQRNGYRERDWDTRVGTKTPTGGPHRTAARAPGCGLHDQPAAMSIALSALSPRPTGPTTRTTPPDLHP